MISVLSRFSRLKLSSTIRLMPVLLILMELLCVYPWFVWLDKYYGLEDPKPYMNFLSYLIVMLYTAIIGKGHENDSYKRKVLTFSSIILLWAVLLKWNFSGGYTLRDTAWFAYLKDNLFSFLIAAFSGLYFIWRTINIQRQTTYGKFIAGLTSLISLSFIWALSGLEEAGWSSIDSYAFLYLFAGLLALALANFENLNSKIAHHGEHAVSFRRRLLSMQLIIIFTILGITLVIAGIFSSDVSNIIIGITNFLWDILSTGLNYIFYFLRYIVSVVILAAQYIFKDMNLLDFYKPDGNSKSLVDQSSEMFRMIRIIFIPYLTIIMKWGLIAALFTLFIFFIRRMLKHFSQSKAEDDVEEEVESLWSWAYLKNDLRNLLLSLFPWLSRRKKEVNEAAVIIPVISEIDPDKDLNVRDMFRALLQHGRKMGIPRISSETAFEYSTRLRKECRITGKELNAITEAYIIERYNEIKTTPEKLSLLNRLWKSLRVKLLKDATSGN